MVGSVVVGLLLMVLVSGDQYAHMRVSGADRSSIPNVIYNVLSYGAKGDGKTNDTAAIQATIDACEEGGGGTVLLPSGYTFLSGSLFLASNMSMYIAINATLLGSMEFSDYPMPFYSRYAGTMGVGHASLLNAAVCLDLINSTAPGDNCVQWSKKTNIILEGGGLIDGQGSPWWTGCDPICPDGSNSNQRPTLLGLLWVNGLTIDNLHLANSPFWTTHPTFSNNVLIANLIITAPSNSPNTDGIDPDSCSEVFIDNCYISTGDDCIAVKSGKDLDGRTVGIPTTGVLVEHCSFGFGHGVSIGSEMSANVTNIVFRNSTCNGTNTGVRIKTMRGRGGFVEDITYENFEFFNVGQAISIDMQYQPAPPTNASATPTFKNFQILNIVSTQTASSAGEFICLPESPCTNITLSNVIVSGKTGYSCEAAYGTMENVVPIACLQSQ